MRRHRDDQDEANVDMTPMLDIVFIMLIFFIVTTSFVKENTVNMSRPSNNQSEQTDNPSAPVAIEITDLSEIRMEGRIIDVGAVQANIERKRAENPKTVVIIQAHEEAGVETLVSVVDGVREAGISSPIVARLPNK